MLALTPSHAVTPDCTGNSSPYSCRTVVSSIDKLAGAGSDYSAPQFSYISVTCYHEPLSAASICAGGGDFDQIVAKQSGCPSTLKSDSATIIKDSVGNCFFRKNFGLNGIVDARQCGVYGDGAHPTDAATLKNCMNIAAQNGIYRVSTGGGVVLDDHSNPNSGGDYNIIPPSGMELTCGGNNTGTAADDDYRIIDKNLKPVLTNAIVLDLRDCIELSQNNTAFTHCNLLAGATGGVPGGTTANPYSPSVYYPSCSNTSIPCTDTGGPLLRSAINEYSAYNPNPTAAYPSGGPASASVGIKLTGGENLRVEDVTVLGFGTCFLSPPPPDAGGKRMTIVRLYGDCDTGISVNNSSNETDFSGFVITSFLTRNNGAGSQLIPHITTIRPGSIGRYNVAVDGLNCTNFTFKQNDTVWIETSPFFSGGTGAESAAGRWLVAALPSNCSSGIQSFDLVGSRDAHVTPLSLKGNMNMAGSLPPPNAIYGIATGPTTADGQTMQLVAVGQTVSGPCIPSGSTVTVTDVWPAQGIVYLSANANNTCSNATYTFTDNAFIAKNCNNGLDAGCAATDSITRMGDGIVVTDSGGVTAVNCATFGHLVSFHFSTGANSSRFANCATGENVALPDQDIVGLKIDGDHVSATGDACGNSFVNGILGQHRTVGILVQSNCTDPNHISDVRFSGSPGGRRNAVALEVDAGTVGLVNSDAFGTDNVFKAGQTQLYDSSGSAAGPPVRAALNIGNNQVPNATLFFSDTTAPSTTMGCGNAFLNIPTDYRCSP